MRFITGLLLVASALSKHLRGYSDISPQVFTKDMIVYREFYINPVCYLEERDTYFNNYSLVKTNYF